MEINDESIKSNAEIQISSDKSYKNDIPQFLEWRNNTVIYYTNLCKNLKPLNSYQATKLIVTLKNLPKCIKHLSRYKCRCDEECLESSLKELEYSKECSYFDTEINADIDDDEYVDCRFLDDKLLYSDIVLQSYFKRLRSDLYDKITEICDYMDLQPKFLYCQAYFVRDMCENKIDCIEFYLNEKNPIFCYYTDYLQHINNLNKILGLSLFKSDFISDKLSGKDIKRESAALNEYLGHRKLLSIEESRFRETHSVSSVYNLSNNIFYIYCVLILSTLGYVFYKTKFMNINSICLSLLLLLSTGIFFFNY